MTRLPIFRATLWQQWVVLTAIGAVIGAVLGGCVGFLALHPVERFLFWSGICGRDQGVLGCLLLGLVLIGSIVFGTTIGFAQSLVLRSRIRRATLWILASSLGWGAIGVMLSWLSFMPFDLPRDLLPVIAWVIAAGGFLGVLQWLILRLSVRRAGWWIVMNLSATALSVLLIILTGQRIGGVLNISIFMIACAFLNAALTGKGIAWLLRTP